MGKKFEEVIEDKLTEIERNSDRLEWPQLKKWLESFYGLLAQNMNSPFSIRHILRISKIFTFSLSSLVPDPLHKIVIDIFEFIVEYIPENQVIILAFGILPHVRSCTANNFGEYLKILRRLFNKFKNVLCIRLCLIFCILNGIQEHGEKNNSLKLLIEEQI